MTESLYIARVGLKFRAVWAADETAPYSVDRGIAGEAEMADQYADAINEAIAALRKGWGLAQTKSETDLWFAALERVRCIETMQERRNG